MLLRTARGGMMLPPDENTAPQWRHNEAFMSEDQQAWEQPHQAHAHTWGRAPAERTPVAHIPAVHEGVSLDDTPVGGGGNTRTFEELLEQELARSGGGSGAPPPPLSRCVRVCTHHLRP